MNIAAIKPSQALTMFRLGLDTAQIAERLGCSEPTASRYVWVARCHEQNLPADFLNRGGEVRRITRP